MRSYFSHMVERATHSETLEAALAALADELPPDVHADITQRIRGEIERLTGALSKIAKGYPCSTREDMQEIANRAVPLENRRAGARIPPDQREKFAAYLEREAELSRKFIAQNRSTAIDRRAEAEEVEGAGLREWLLKRARFYDQRAEERAVEDRRE